MKPFHQRFDPCPHSVGSADLQSAVPPICNRRSVGRIERVPIWPHSAEFNSAIRQTASLRYNPSLRSADFQSAVPPSCTRQRAGQFQRAQTCRRLAGCNPALRQTASLRYGVWKSAPRWFALAALVLIVEATGCGPKTANTLKVGMELAYPPFEMTDEQGRPQGVSVDLAHALGKSLGRDVEIQNLPFDGLIPALKTGKIDLIVSSMTATTERAQSIDFSEPYLKTGLTLLVGKDSSIQSIQDVDQPGKVLAVKLGTTGHQFATAQIKHAKVLVLDKEDACVLEVVQGKADAFIYDQMSTFKNWQRHRETTRPILKPFQEESWAMGIRKGNSELLGQVNRFLKDFRAKGGFEALGDRYLKEQKEAFKQLGIGFFF